MLKNNKKGFTLIEILAAITILGILMSIAIISVTKVIENGKKKHYTTAESNMVLAGQSYVQQNRVQLPKAIGQKKKVYLQTLVDNNYIQPIKDYSDNECNMAESYVQIFKYSQSDYSYVSYLECPNYNSQKNINDITPSITASISVDTNSGNSTASITIEGNDKLMSYSYIIYRNGKEVKNTGSVASSKESVSLNFSLNEYTPGDIKLTITATNIYGNTKTKTITKDVPDTQKPTCVYLDEADQNAKTWTNANRKITVGCDDGGTGSGCKRATYTKTFKTTTDYGYITIEDEEGNKTNCRVSVFVDKTDPTCTKSGDSTTWTKNNRTITWGCSDGTNQSGCNTSYSGGSTTFSTTTKTASIAAYTIKDNAGNTVTCAARTANVYVDKDKPTCTDSGDSTTWTKNNRTITWGCSDGTNQSGCDSDYDGGSTTFSATTKTSSIAAYTIKDEAGNENTCAARTANVYVDKTKPACTDSGDSTTWTSSNRTITWGCSDADSGCNTSYSGGTTTFSTTTKTSSIAAYTIKDAAGNETACSARTANVYVDKDKPTCTNSGDSTTWTSGDRTITWGCSDGTNQSGCNSSYSGSSKTFTTSTTTSTIAAYTIKDTAGNETSCAARTANVYVDKTKPTISSITNPTGGTATSTPFALTLNGSDGHSGIAKWRYKYAASTSWTDYANSNKSPFTTTNFSAARNENVYISVCDNVGNCSDASTSPIYIVADLCASTEEYSWTDWVWSSCTENCGGGTQYQYRTAYLRSAYNHSTYCSSTTQYQNQNSSCNTHACSEDIYATRYVGCNIYYITTCDSTNCNYTSLNGSAATGTVAKSSLSTSRSSGCSCPDGTLIFGAGKGVPSSANYGASADTSSWTNNWCYASGGPCSPNIGWTRYCIHESCYGMSRDEVNAAWGCTYSKYWCSCS